MCSKHLYSVKQDPNFVCREIKESQTKTRQLENEKRKMEERLQELRMAMEIEREERAFVCISTIRFVLF